MADFFFDNSSLMIMSLELTSSFWTAARQFWALRWEWPTSLEDMLFQALQRLFLLCSPRRLIKAKFGRWIEMASLAGGVWQSNWPWHIWVYGYHARWISRWRACGGGWLHERVLWVVRLASTVSIPIITLATSKLTQPFFLSQSCFSCPFFRGAATRWVKGLRGLTYEERLQALKLQPLGKRSAPSR